MSAAKWVRAARRELALSSVTPTARTVRRSNGARTGAWQGCTLGPEDLARLRANLNKAWFSGCPVCYVKFAEMDALLRIAEGSR